VCFRNLLGWLCGTWSFVGGERKEGWCGVWCLGPIMRVGEGRGGVLLVIIYLQINYEQSTPRDSPISTVYVKVLGSKC